MRMASPAQSFRLPIPNRASEFPPLFAATYRLRFRRVTSAYPSHTLTYFFFASGRTMRCRKTFRFFGVAIEEPIGVKRKSMEEHHSSGQVSSWLVCPRRPFERLPAWHHLDRGAGLESLLATLDSFPHLGFHASRTARLVGMVCRYVRILLVAPCAS